MNIMRLCRLYNECGSWKKVAELEGVTPQWLATFRKKHIKMTASPKDLA